MDDKPVKMNYIFHEAKRICVQKKAAWVFGGPKVPPMHLCCLKAAHFKIIYEIKGQI